MLVVGLEQLRPLLDRREIIAAIEEAFIAQAQGLCDTPMPMHLDVPSEAGEVHIKASYRRGGGHYALKIATTFPNNLARGLSTGNGMVLLASAQTGAPVALIADEGHLTDVRTAAAGAVVARALGRRDSAIGILGTGIQARLQAQMHAEVLPLRRVCVWGRTAERVEQYRRDLGRLLPEVEVTVAHSPAALASEVRLIVTTTAARQPLLPAPLQRGTHVTAVGADGPGKRELDPEILRKAALLLVDSRAQCERLGELQHALDQRERAVELGAFCASPVEGDRDGVTVCDLTGLGAQDLAIAEHCYRKLQPRSGA